MLAEIAQIVTIIGFPLLTIWGSQRYNIIEQISPIVLCFAIGIIVCNFQLFDINDEISNLCRDGAILLALPLLLFSSDIKSWFKDSKTLIGAFALCVLSGLIACSIAAFTFQHIISDIWIPSGMMVGIYTGGTPNLFAVGMALGAEDEVFTLLNSAEIFWGAVYLLFLLSSAAKVFGWILPDYKISTISDNKADYLTYKNIKIRDVLLGLLLAILVVGFSVGISHLLTGSIDATIVIVLITSLSILASLKQTVRELNGTFEIGDYFLLMFGVAAGMLSDFQSLINDGAGYISFVLAILILVIVINLILARIFKIDKDTFIIASAAGLYGPVFIPQVARALGNKSIIVGGISVSLIGLAVGNYLGIGLGQILSYLLS